MRIISENDKIKVFNEGIELIVTDTIEELKIIVETLVRESKDKWELEILRRVLYTIDSNNCSTKAEVA